MQRPRVLSASSVFRNPWIHIVERTVEFDGKSDQYYSVEGPPHIVSILGINPEGAIALISQYRFAVDAITLDLPGGAVEASETIDEAACREFIEETGYELEHPKKLASFFLDSGQKNSTKHLIMGRCGGSPLRSAEARIDLQFRDMKQLCDEIRAGLHNEPSLVIALLLLEQRGLLAGSGLARALEVPE